MEIILLVARKHHWIEIERRGASNTEGRPEIESEIDRKRYEEEGGGDSGENEK